jgi:ANTAR domain/GAF domain
MTDSHARRPHDQHAPDHDAPDQHVESREGSIANAFVHLADTLVVDYDIIDFLHYLIECSLGLIDADEAGVMLASPSGHLQPIAASTERIRLLELFELQNQDGPCLDAFRTGETVIAADLEQERERWPNFATEALQVGFRAAHSIPMRLRDDTIGAINLLRINTGDLTGEDTKLARALADIATIGVIQERTISQSSTTTAALQHALMSRIRIEQAKGMLAERAGISIDDAFELLRGYARRHQLGLTRVADDVVHGTLEIPLERRSG